MEKLVSIITPCYNGQKYLRRYFESILEQTYPYVELIFVNDGSTDDTEDVAMSYKSLLEQKGYKFIYIFQDNAGQSAAINQGLKVFKGEYLNWMDSDDYLPADSIEKRVNYLERNPDVGLVIGRTSIVDDKGIQLDILSETGLDRVSPYLLIEDYLSGKMSNACCSTMVRTSMFKDSMPDELRIETPREIGQNYQLFIPIMIKYPVRYIEDILSYCVVHNDSHSHSRKTYEQKMHILDVATETLNSIANRLSTNDSDRNWFRSKVAEYDCKNRLDVMQHYRRSDGLDNVVALLKNLHSYDAAARKMVLKIKYPSIKRLGDRIWKWKNK